LSKVQFCDTVNGVGFNQNSLFLDYNKQQQTK